jgi:glycerophosphoryl diester phosphodiesterase
MARLAGMAVLFCFALAAEAQLVIAHRGASGSLPEHTLAAYRLAIEHGADYIEADLVMTKDGVLVARHENEISATTDVAARSEFAARRTTKSIDGRTVSGWFTEDFTLRELKTLRARERIPELRPHSALHDGKYEVPTFEELLLLLSAQNRERKTQEHQRIGVYPETKHPAYFESIGLPLEEPLVALLEKYGYRGRQAKAFIQSFEPASLRKLAKLTQVPLVQLLSPRRPFELAAIAAYAQGIGPAKELLIPRRADGSLGPPAALAREAHAQGLFVHAWTFRAENAFLPADFRSAAGPAAHGDFSAELARYRSLGIEGLFTDHPALAR